MRARIMNIAVMFLFGTIGYFVKNTGMSSALIAAFRSVAGVIVLLLACALTRRSLGWTAIRKNFWILAVSGVVMGANWVFLFEAYKYTTVAVATLSYYMAPVYLVLISAVLFRERLTSVRVICILISVAGMALVADVFGAGPSGDKAGFGVFLGICAGAAYAVVVTLNRFMKEIDPMETTIMQLFFAAAAMIPYALFTTDLASITVTGSSVVSMLILGIVHTGIAYLIYFSTIKNLSVQTVAVFSYIDPVTAIACSGLLLNERVSAVQIVGAVMILGSTLCSELWTARRERLCDHTHS